MKYALVHGEKVEAFPKGIGLCICCNTITIAKCGTKKIDHLAHRSLIECDAWWENETQWHRDWKAKFPKAWQEVVHFDTVTGEKHIADIKTEKGFVIELQNSPMALEELRSREQFYKKMLWIINGQNFVKQFEILNKLPDPKAEFVKDIAFHWAKGYEIKGFHKPSENPGDPSMVLVHSIQDIQAEIDEHYVGHHFFYWKNPRTVWFEAGCDVFIDFGGSLLWKMIKYDQRGLFAIKKISKEYFLDRALI